MDLDRDENTTLTLPGSFNSERFYPLHLMWFKILILEVLICSGQGPDTRGGGCLNLRPHHEENKPYPPGHMTQQTLTSEEK
jgi:hypothetical protein